MTTKTKANKKGLVKNQDNAIFIEANTFEETWDVMKTTVGGHQATTIFTFKTVNEAMNAGREISWAIDGIYYGITDPRIKDDSLGCIGAKQNGFDSPG